MGFRLFKREKKKRITLEELEKTLKEEIEAHRMEVERFTEENYSNLKTAVDGLIREVDSLNVDVLPKRLKGVTKNFISMMRKQWQVKEDSPPEFFEEVSAKAAKLAVSMRRAYRILFAIRLPELEDINEKIKEVSSIISAYEEKKNDPAVLRKYELLARIEELRGIEDMISKYQNKLERLEMMNGENEEETEIDKTAEYRGREKEITEKLSALEAELQKKLGMVRKPLRIYAHMVGERLEISGYRDLEKEKLQRMAERVKSEIVKGGLEVKESQKEGILKSLDFIARGESRKVIEEIDSLKKELVALQAKIKTMESRKRSKAAGKRHKIEKEILTIKRQIESYVQKKGEIMEEIREMTFLAYALELF